jgi:hypothetical protein
MGPKVSRSSRKPVEIGRVWRRSSAAAATDEDSDGEPGPRARRRRTIAISGASPTRSAARRRRRGGKRRLANVCVREVGAGVELGKGREREKVV